MRLLLALALLLAAPAVSAARLEEAKHWRSLPFGRAVIWTDASEKRAAEVVRQLSVFRAVLELSTRHVNLDSTRPTHFFVFRDPRSMALYEPGGGRHGVRVPGVFNVGHVPGAERYAVLAVEPVQDFSSPASFQRYRSPYKTLFHEFTHHIMEATIPGVPRWLSEGAAEYFETFRVLGSVAEVGRANTELVGVLLHGPRLPMRRLMDDDPERPLSLRERMISDAQSWAIVHYCLRGDPVRSDQFGRFLALLRDGTPQSEAWETAFAEPPDAIRDEAIEYVFHGKFAVGRFDVRKMHVPEPGESSRVDRAELHARLAKLLLRTSWNHDDDAEARARSALARTPDQPIALWALAEIRRRQGLPEEAARLGEAALGAARGDRALETEAASLLSRLREAASRQP